MTEYWHKLTLTGDPKQLELIGASITPFSCGLEEKLKSWIFFIEENQKFKIEKILNIQKQNYSIKVNWDYQQREDWHLMWKENFMPIEIDGGFKIIPDWDDTPLSDSIIKIKPGMAFGTGHHETTYMMLENMPKVLKPGMKVLDMGSGSGILSIAAEKLKAGKITAIEFDRDCLDNFNENVELNKSSGIIDYLLTDVLQWTDFNYDLILANINKSIIKSLIPNLIGNNAKFFLTGLLIEDEEEICNMLKVCGFQIVSKQYKDEWLFLYIKGNENI